MFSTIKKFKDQGGKFDMRGVEGEINSYGMKDVMYNGNLPGRVWVEDFLESSSAAWDEIDDHCY